MPKTTAKPAAKKKKVSAAAIAPAPAPKRRRPVTISTKDAELFGKDLLKLKPVAPMRRESDEVTIAKLLHDHKAQIQAALSENVTIQQIYDKLKARTKRDIPYDMFTKQVRALGIIRRGIEVIYPSPKRRFIDENSDRRVSISGSGRSLRVNDKQPGLTTTPPTKVPA